MHKFRPTSRVARLERRCQVNTLVIVIQSCVLGGVLLGGAGRAGMQDVPAPTANAAQAAAPATVTARQFKLVDEQGRPRAEWRCTLDGPAISLLDEQGNDRLTLSVTAQASLISIGDAKGNDRARVIVTALGPSISLFDEEARERVRASVGAAGPAINILDEDRTPRWTAPR